ncbi:MAG: PEP-CTERM sorting domain-containing protein, partial [Myxococcota bacterium]
TLYTSTLFQNSNQALVNGVTVFPLGGALDFSDIQAIRLTLSGVDLLGEAPTITSIVAVPEPASGVLVAMGLLGLVVRRRRCR